MVSKRNLLVKRTGVSLTAKEEEEEEAVAGDGSVVVGVCLRGADEGNKHLLYIVAVGRLNGTILHR